MKITEYPILTDAGWMVIYRTARRNALKRGIPFDLTTGDFKQMVDEARYQCAITGIIFECGDAQGQRRPWFPSIDRIDSSKGYTKENCRLVCVAVNLAMNVWGEDVLNRIVRAIAKRNAAKRKPKITLEERRRTMPSDFLLYL